MTATLQLTRTWAALTDRGKWQILIDGTAVEPELWISLKRD
jgi:hypothetical protein